MTKEELLKKAKEVRFAELRQVPILSGIFIIQQRKLHDSGYRMMYVIGHTDFDYLKKDYNYYLLGTYSDVVDFDSFFTKVYMDELHLDISKKGIIHIWSNRNRFRCTHMVSNCTFEVVK